MLQGMWDRLRRPGGGPDPDRAGEEIVAFELRATEAPPQRRAPLFNRAGDLCVKEGEYERALRNFGRAIDAYLETGFRDAAPALCRKAIRVSPEVIRARATLASISLANGMFSEAEQEIGAYVRAAEAAQGEELAARRLRLIAAATENAQVRVVIGEYLLELGDPVGADRVFGRVYAERNGLRPRLSSDEDERWSRLLPVVLLGPDELAALDARSALA